MRKTAFRQFWQRMHRSARKEGVPLRVMFELTYRCNFRCRHCYVPDSFRRRKELSTSRVLRILDQLAEAGCFYLGFTGGEPLMRKDILQILRYARDKGFQVILYTNGSLIDAAMADKLRSIGLNKVDITLAAANAGVFDRIAGQPHAGQRVFRAIELLRARNIPLGLKTSLLKDNQGEIGRIRRFCRSLGIRHRLERLLSPRLDGSTRPYRYRGSCGGADPAGPGSAGGCDLLAETARRQSRAELFTCGTGRSQAAITPSGKLKMCLMIDHPGYDLLKAGFKKGWQDLKRLVAGIRAEQNDRCDHCQLQPSCHWCPGRAWLLNRGLISCDPQNKRQVRWRSSQVSESRPPRPGRRLSTRSG